MRVSQRADAAVDAILADSVERFGIEAMRKYRLLLSAAFQDVARDPEGRQSRKVIDTPAGFGLYHIRNSVRTTPGFLRVKQPRHYVAFWFDDAEVVILDILHERMDLPTRFAGLLADRGLPPSQ